MKILSTKISTSYTCFIKLMLTFLIHHNYTKKLTRIFMNRREILKEIDATLDQLIKNAAALKDVADDTHLSAALHKTQESLLAHLVHLDDFLDKPPKAQNEKRELLTELSKKPATRRKRTKQTL